MPALNPAMPALRIFVSHSSRLRDDETSAAQAQANWRLLQETCCALRDAYPDDMEVLVDYDGLQPGDDWEKSLDGWLYDCHAGVLLLSKCAVQSQWVRKEASILCWRAANEPDFRLYPVLLDGQTPEDIDRDPFFRTLRLSRFGVVQDVACSKSILAALRLRLDERVSLRRAPRTPFEKIVAAVESIFAAEIDERTLEEHCRRLGEQSPPRCHLDRRRALARSLACALLRDGKSAQGRFRQLIADIFPRPPRERVEEVFKYVRSLWVDAGAAGTIADAKEAGSALALNGEFVATEIPECDSRFFTLDRYLERAWPDSSEIRIVSVTRMHSAEEIWQGVREGCSPLRSSPGRCLPAARLDQHVRQYSGHLIVLLTPAPETAPDPELLGELKGKALTQGCPSLIFVYNVGPQMPPPSLLPGLQPILPALRDGEDDLHATEEIQTRETLKRYYS